MFQYIVKRILYFIPTLFVISLLAFGLSKCTPGDPCNAGGGEENSKSSFINFEDETRSRCELFGLDKPTFYFALTSRAYPDSLYKILQKDQRKSWNNLIAQYGNWDQISAYKTSIRTLQLKLFDIPDSLGKRAIRKIKNESEFLKILSKDEAINAKLKKIETIYNNSPAFENFIAKEIVALKNYYNLIKEKSTPNQLYVPTIHWYGFDNQYHNWITNFLTGDFGISYKTYRPVFSEIRDAIFWTFLMMSLALILSYSVAIPLGVFSAKNKNLRFDKIVTVLLFVLYSLPAFWVATMMVVFLTTPEYGSWTNIFPGIGLGNLSSNAPFWERFWETAKHLILPVLCLSYNRLAFISRQMRGGMLGVIQEDYIRTARAKGLGEQSVIWKHGFRNSLFPIITLFANILPSTLAGSVIIEFIFNIPGMGKLTLDAISQENYPIVFAVLMIAALATLVGILIADILYAVADPRISFDKK